jgi:phosphoglycolate phosphatase-like HAD superfamily hydrolase
MSAEHAEVEPVAMLFDVDGTLISTGGAGTRSWRWAFELLHGVPADIGKHSEAGMTDPVVGRTTFREVIGREPTDREMSRLMAAYLERLPVEVRESEHYRVLAGVDELLPRLQEVGLLLGIVTGALEAAAHIKLARAGLERFFAFGGYGSDTDDREELTRVAIDRAGAILGWEVPSSRVAVVGDTPRDVEAARSVGAQAVGVASGKYSTDELRRAGASFVLGSLEDPIPGVIPASSADRHRPMGSATTAESSSSAWIDAMLDEAGRQSFPASDPPALMVDRPAEGLPDDVRAPSGPV